MMNNTIYITGHRHPDSDSICSAIALADLYNRLGEHALPIRQGPLNEETKFILKKFHRENPLLLTDARTQLKDMDMDTPAIISCHETVHHAWHVMLDSQNKSLFVVDENGVLCGICTTSNLSQVRLKKDSSLDALMRTAKLEDIAKTIAAKIVTAPETYHGNGTVKIITLGEEAAKEYELKDSICVLSSGLEKQKKLVEEGASCIVITCGVKAEASLIDLAKEKGCAILETSHDTMHVARIITESYTVENVMSKNLICFNEEEYIDDVAAKMMKSRVRSYPVLNDEGKIVGAISRYHTLNYQKKRLVLVDHSVKAQSIAHVENARIEAIIDHHQIGDIQTTYPIMYRNVRCGCTATVISELFQENGLLPDGDISGLLMSAILSDTLNFKSATTTDMDRLAVSWLAKRAGITDVDAYAREMLGASVSLKDSSMHEILNRDLKNYTIGKYNLAVGQTNYSHMEDVQKILPEFKENLLKEQEEKKLDLLVMLFTDVMGEGSLFVYYGALSGVLGDFIETNFDDHSGFDPHIISRKQQLIPELGEILESM